MSLWKFADGVYFENSGYHQHPRPTHLLHLTSDEEAQFTEIVQQHPQIGPLGLVIGVPTLHGPGRSVADISTVLLNKDRVKKERQKLKKGGSHGGDHFLAEFADFCAEHPGFVIHSSISANIVVSMQTSLMVSQLVKESLLDGAVNGLVSDAAHRFWLEQNSLLIVTSCYAPSLNRWIPGLFTYSNGASALHFEHHFYALFESIAKEARNRSLTVSDTMFSGV
ncbi:hypothetical protein A0H81_13654 [Grifola frondosa]|uniref:Uncharacterized protein n=1 Tax=Grifola frondosa TaxID=5627 RepID=A0A1C7LP10_GRIFR|nr:hypothetical protein A0H81_13654 [Grifola frondosa]